MWTLQDAKNKFSAVVNAALVDGPQHVTRRGQAAVVVVSAEDWARLNAVAPAKNLLEHLLDMPAAPDDAAEQAFQDALTRVPVTYREADWGA